MEAKMQITERPKLRHSIVETVTLNLLSETIVSYEELGYELVSATPVYNDSQIWVCLHFKESK